MATTMETAFETVGELVRTFHANKHAYLARGYAEAQARKDFIDKLFIALGWDVNHDVQKNPYEQEVKVEPPVTVGARQRHADYAFRLAPNFNSVRFFVEAKKPSADVVSKENYFQVIRYGWNSQTPLAVLSDFQVFHVLDCRYKPDVETALNQAIAKYHYTEYTKREKFAEIYWLFSREAVAQGSLEKRAKELPKPRGKAVQRGLFPGGYQSIDESFLAELDDYRKSLARTFKNRNPRLDSDTLTELAQRTLDRLVLLRFLEDKGIEAQRLVERFGEKATAWEDFIAASRRLDKIYNGIVYKHHDILDAATFRVDDHAFANICESLAHVNSPYDFNAIPIQILGSIYERFLGKVIVATDKRAKVEEKREVRKAGGVYYTPQYIVRYIVENTVGKLITRKTPKQIAEMCFADIACGSGSFLIEVFDVLLKYHGHYYNDNPRKARKGDCIKRDGKLYLSLRKKREILLNNIYGVDIDAQAVEVCQLSLYLKLLEEETEASAHEHQMEFRETLLPPLNKNVVCGNSLIGADILDGQLFATDEERKLNPMNFEDRFPEVMKRGGFDAIVGNPPYIFTRNQGIPEIQKIYFYSHYKHQSAQLNTFGLFMEKSWSLLRQNGAVGFITPNNWLTIHTFAPLRRFMLQNTGDLHITNVLDRVFAAADVDTCVVATRRCGPSTLTIGEIKDQSEVFSRTMKHTVAQAPSFIIQISLLKDGGAQRLLQRIESVSKPLSAFATVSTGLKAYQIGKGKPRQTDEQKGGRVFHAKHKLNQTYRRYLHGVDVSRYSLGWSGEWLSYGDWLAEPRRSVPFDGERLLVRQIPSRPPYLVDAVFTKEAFYNDINIMVIFNRTGELSMKYLLGVINSRLVSLWFQKKYDKLQRKIFPQFKVRELADFPIRPVDFSDAAEREGHAEIVAKVEAMLEAKKQLAKVRTDRDKAYYENKCASLDRQIDRVVYEVYGLTEAEIRIVEETQ